MNQSAWRVFYWGGRARRREYWTVLLIGIAIFAGTFSWRTWGTIHEGVPEALFVLGALSMAPAAVLIQFGIARRLHDVGISEYHAYWTVIFWFCGGFLGERFGVPPLAGAVAAAFLFALLVGIPRGNAGDNAYGPDPRKQVG